MAVTRTGSFPIGFRRGWSEWQKDLGKLIEFAKTNGFECLDTAAIPESEVKQVTSAGLSVGSADVQAWGDLLSADAGKRKAAVQLNADYINKVTPLGVKNYFTILMPEDPARARKENFDLAVDSYSRLCEQVEASGAKIVVEGWPGGAPYLPVLACTPETYRALFKEVPSPVMAVNFDPSHLIRMGIDSYRFVNEFADRVAHVHAKDTWISDEALYEFGNLQAATFATDHVCGGQHWRYTVPGHGVARWGDLFAVLVNTGYKGFVSIELEDEDFLGGGEDDKLGLIASRDFLIHA